MQEEADEEGVTVDAFVKVNDLEVDVIVFEAGVPVDHLAIGVPFQENQGIKKTNYDLILLYLAARIYAILSVKEPSLAL